MRKIFYFDIESTGTDKIKNDIIQLSGIIEIDGKVKETFNFRCQPFDYDNVQQEALDVTGLKLEDIKKYPSPRDVYNDLVELMAKYVNKFDRNDKFYPAGYNVGFDVGFLNEFFKKNGDNYYGSWFNWRLIDGLALIHFLDYCGKFDLENHKLSTVCDHFNIKINAHDALSDIEATKKVINKIEEFLK